MLNIQWFDILYIAGLAIVLFFILMFFNFFISLLPAAASDFLTRGFHWQPPKSISPLYLLFFTLAIGFREEFFFRSYLLTRLVQLGLPLPGAIIISALLFSVGHIYEGVIALLFAFTQAIIFSYFFMFRRSLPVIAFAHGLYNFISLLLATYSGG